MVNYDSTFCDVQVDVLPAGAGGPSTFSLVSGGTPANCASAVVSGIYVKDAALNTTNYVDVAVNVSVIGTYTITAAGGGMIFTKSGAFITTGNQTVRLTATGTPATAGANVVTFSLPAGGCTFNINVVAPAVYTVDCPSSLVGGTYQAGTALGASNTITLSLNITTAGPVSITTTAVNGMVFSGAANFTTTGTQSLVLTGSGTPTAGGTFNIPVPTSCNVPVTVAAAPSVDWKFTAGSTTYQGTSLSAILTSVLPPTISLAFTGMNGANDQIGLNLIDVSGTISNNETYSTVLSASNSAVFLFQIAGGTDNLSNDATRNITFTITSHNTTTKTITGKFNGQAKNNAGTTVAITNGEFTAVYL
jgi:hypothetical protein